MKVEFGLMREDELRECYELCKSCFGEYASFENVRETYELCRDDRHYRFIVGRADGRIVAYTTMVIYYNLFDGKYPIASLWYVCVDKDYRRQGVASALFREIDRIADENSCEIISLTCASENTGARRFYRSLGYSEDSEIAFVRYIYEQWEEQST